MRGVTFEQEETGSEEEEDPASPSEPSPTALAVAAVAAPRAPARFTPTPATHAILARLKAGETVHQAGELPPKNNQSL